MKRNATLIAGILAATLVVPNIAQAQTQPPADKTAPVTGMKPDRTTADPATRKKMQAKEAELRKKRTACRAEAKAEKVSLLKRPAYVKKCMAN